MVNLEAGGSDMHGDMEIVGWIRILLPANLARPT